MNTMNTHIALPKNSSGTLGTPKRPSHTSEIRTRLQRVMVGLIAFAGLLLTPAGARAADWMTGSFSFSTNHNTYLHSLYIWPDYSKWAESGLESGFDGAIDILYTEGGLDLGIAGSIWCEGSVGVGVFTGEGFEVSNSEIFEATGYHTEATFEANADWFWNTFPFQEPAPLNISLNINLVGGATNSGEAIAGYDDGSYSFGTSITTAKGAANIGDPESTAFLVSGSLNGFASTAYPGVGFPGATPHAQDTYDTFNVNETPITDIIEESSEGGGYSHAAYGGALRFTIEYADSYVYYSQSGTIYGSVSMITGSTGSASSDWNGTPQGFYHAYGWGFGAVSGSMSIQMTW